MLQIEVSTIISQAGVTLSGLVSRTQDLVSKLKTLQLDRHEFVCLKYLVLFNPGELLFFKVQTMCECSDAFIIHIRACLCRCEGLAGSQSGGADPREGESSLDGAHSLHPPWTLRQVWSAAAEAS